MSEGSERIISYDLFRGFLLSMMVLYHILVNFFWKTETHLFHWVSTGFILFLGLVVGQFLLNKPTKTLWLGAKLGGIYLAGNLLITWWKELDWSNWIDFLTAGDQDLAVFEILLPMTYLLLISAFLGKILHHWPKQIPKLILISIPLGLLFMLNFTQDYWYNLIYLSYGLIGLVLGWAINLDEHLKTVRKRPPLFTLAILGFLIILAAQFYLQQSLLFFTAGQVICLYLASSPVLNFGKKAWLWLGQNSLGLYVIHILLIKVIQIILS